MSSLLDATRVHARDVMGHVSRSWGMHLMETAFPVARTVVGIPAGVTFFVAGWALQFVSHNLTEHAEDIDSNVRLDEAAAELLG